MKLFQVLLLNGIFLSVLFSCSALSNPHENFKAHMFSAVGKHISDPHIWARQDRYVSVRALESGNMEHKYMFRGSCFYFFEVEKDTEMIVSWRYEGSENDCQIVP